MFKVKEDNNLFEQARVALKPLLRFRRHEPERTTLHGHDDVLAERVVQSWEGLTRSIDDLKELLPDPVKNPLPEGAPYHFYLPEEDNPEQRREEILARHPDWEDRIQFMRLPKGATTIDEATPFPEKISEFPPQQGLLYLPYPYVVPGGRFNEMYGWDSAFITKGLVRSGDLERAFEMIENGAYQIENYGKILNSNRSFSLGRSQPPFLGDTTRFLFDKFEENPLEAERIFASHGGKYENIYDWLLSRLQTLELYHEYWTSPPMLDESTGLSRYYSEEGTPSPEVLNAEPGHYHHAAERLEALAAADPERWGIYVDIETGELTEHYFKADRAMRSSGFDPSGRFGPFNTEIMENIPVCLNSLLFGIEEDASIICGILARAARAGKIEASASDLIAKQQAWRERAASRKTVMDEVLWVDGYGYTDLNTRIGEYSEYGFGTGFFPMWAGMATQEQADVIVNNLLPKLETEYGLMASPTISGAQWDAPYMWMPLVMLTVRALKNYGFYEDAVRIADKALETVERNFEKHGGLYEKYNAMTGGIDVHVNQGYSENVADPYGFGWTNASVLFLREQLLELTPLLEQSQHVANAR